MKKQAIIITILCILIPFIVVTFFIPKEKEEVLIDYGLISKKDVRVLRNETNNIEYIPIEEYIVGVVSGEMPVSFEIEALKAQSVAARSYVINKMDINKDLDYDVIDTVLNQVYQDDLFLQKKWGDKYVTNINKIRQAVKETESEVVFYDNIVINAMYFSTSNGYTENSEDVFISPLPYLKGVESFWDEKESPVFKDTKEFSLEEFYKLIEMEFNDNLIIEVISKTKNGRIKKIKINNKEYDGRDLYTKLKIRSTDFNITHKNNKVYVNTKGFGHGVGMSQYGANGMAKEGYTYEDILIHYYTNVKIKKI